MFLTSSRRPPPRLPLTLSSPVPTSSLPFSLVPSSYLASDTILTFYKAFTAAADIKAAGVFYDILYRHHLARLYDIYEDTES